MAIEIPPAVQLEYKIIGSLLLLEGRDRERIFSTITPEFFVAGEARDIYAKLAEWCREYPEADYSLLLQALTPEEQRTTLSILEGMMDPTIASRQLPDTLAAARKMETDNRLRSAVQGLSISDSISAADIDRLSQIAADGVQNRREYSGADYLENYSEVPKTYPTGFDRLDELLLGGFAAGTLATIGARPSTGKTTFALNIAASDPGRRTLFFSLEMAARMIYDRLIANIADVNYSAAIKHRIPFDTVKAVVNKYNNLKITDDLTDIDEIVRIIKVEKPEMVILDYVQIVTSTRRFVDNRQRIDYISGQLRQAAKAAQCCVVSLSQLGRGGKNKPSMSDLKESGSLEQDSDYVIILHRPYVEDKDGNSLPSETEVTLYKNRFGNTQRMEYDFDGRHQRFTEEIGENNENSESIKDDLPF